MTIIWKKTCFFNRKEVKQFRIKYIYVQIWFNHCNIKKMVGAEAFTYISMASSLRLTSPWETILALSCGGLLLLCSLDRCSPFFSKIWVKDGVIDRPFLPSWKWKPYPESCDVWFVTPSRHSHFFGLSLTTAVNSHHGIPGAKLKCSLGWPKWGFYFYWYPVSTHTNGLLNRQLGLEPL